MKQNCFVKNDLYRCYEYPILEHLSSKLDLIFTSPLAWAIWPDCSDSEPKYASVTTQNLLSGCLSRVMIDEGESFVLLGFKNAYASLSAASIGNMLDRFADGAPTDLKSIIFQPGGDPAELIYIPAQPDRTTTSALLAMDVDITTGWEVQAMPRNNMRDLRSGYLKGMFPNSR